MFDKNYKLLDATWDGISSAANQVGATPVVPHDLMSREYTAKEEGYVFMYVSNESATLVDVYFDDIVMTHTKSNVIQYNEYYPFGMQTANSWTRENTTGNNFLGNGGTELNTTTGVYDLHYRNYDPVLGRMTQVDPLADRYSSFSTYNFAFNDPVFWNDPLGDSPVDDANRSRNADIQRNQANTYRPIGDDMYGSYYSRYGPGDGGALNDFAAPIVERLKWIQAQVAQGASFVGGRVFYSEWVPDGTFGGSYSEDNGKLVKLLPVYVEQRQYLNFDRQQQTGGCPECFIYSNGTKGGEPIIERIDDYPQFSTNWVQYPEGFKFYFDKEFKTLVTNPINPNSYSSLLLALRQSPQYMAGFVNGYNQGYDYYDHVWNNFFNTLAIPLSQMDDSPADEQLLGYYSGFGTGMNDRKNSYPNLLSPKN